MTRQQDLAQIVLRLALGAGFILPVLDRLGYLGSALLSSILCLFSRAPPGCYRRYRPIVGASMVIDVQPYNAPIARHRQNHGEDPLQRYVRGWHYSGCYRIQ